MWFSGDGRLLEMTPDIENDEVVVSYNCTVDSSKTDVLKNEVEMAEGKTNVDNMT